MKRKQYLYRTVQVTPVEPLGPHDLAIELGLMGYRIASMIPGVVQSSLILEREREVEDVIPAPTGQVSRPTRTLWLRREHGDIYFVEKWRGIYDYENPTLPCLDQVRNVTFSMDSVCVKWQSEVSLAAKFLMAKHEGIKEGKEFQFWLPGLTDDEELLK